MTEESSIYWEMIWKLKTHERCIFLWKVYHGSLMINNFRARYEASHSTTCEICDSVTENVLHIMQDF